MNSNYLKEVSSHTYKDFFITHPIVISVPLTYSWIEWQISEGKHMALKQKMPLRVYVGMSPVSEDGRRLWSMFMRDVREKRFVQYAMEEFIADSKGLGEELVARYPQAKSRLWWCCIQVLSELPEGVGCGRSQALMSGIVAAHLVVDGTRWPLELLGLTEGNEELLKKLSDEVNALWYYKDGDSLEMVRWSVCKNQTWKKLLNTLLRNMVVRSWKPYPQCEYSTKNILGSISQELIWQVGDLFAAHDDIKIEELQRTTLGVQTTLLSHQIPSRALRHFFCTVIAPRTAAHQYGRVAQDSSRQGGAFMLFGQKNHAKREHDFQKNTGLEEDMIIYDSLIDGQELNGLIVEQNLRQERYSSFITKGSCVLKSWNGNHHIGDSYQFIQDREHDILLDCTQWKLILKWRKVTSQELYSQLTTVWVLKKLLQSPGKEISQREFGSSSYTKNRNEMVSKIIIPLKKLIKKKLNKDLPLECHWNLISFSLKLGEHNLKIGQIQELPEFSQTERYI